MLRMKKETERECPQVMAKVFNRVSTHLFINELWKFPNSEWPGDVERISREERPESNYNVLMLIPVKQGRGVLSRFDEVGFVSVAVIVAEWGAS